MADSCEWIFHLFGRHHCKSRIFERMENFQNDCCRSWTKKPFKNSYSRQLAIVNAVVCWSPAGQIDWPKSVFLHDKVTLFESMMTTVNEANRDKTKVPDNFFCNVSLVCFTAEPGWVNWFTIDAHVGLLLNSTATNEQLRPFLCFNPLFSVVQLWNYTKTIIRLRLSEYCRLRAQW